MHSPMLVRAAASAALALLISTGAQAALVGVSPNVDLAGGPFTISLGGGAATYTFADAGATGSRLGLPVASVKTEGTARVFANSDFIASLSGENIATFATDDGRRPTFPGQIGEFKAFSEFERINAETPSYIGLSFDVDDETFFGFALVTGRTLFDFAYNDVAGAPAIAQPGPFAPIPDVAPVPLPASAGFLAFAAAGLAALRRRRRAA